MGKLKKASVPASILIESLVALGLFAMITTLLLGEIRRSRKERLADFKEVEVLSVAQMALADQLTVYHQGKVVLHVE